VPGCVAISIRPSGVNASAVGAATAATRVSVKFGGAAVSAGRAEVSATAMRPIAAAAADARRRNTFLPGTTWLFLPRDRSRNATGSPRANLTASRRLVHARRAGDREQEPDERQGQEGEVG